MRKALQLRPGWEESLWNLGKIFQEQGDLFEASKVYAELTSQKPHSAETHNSLGTVLALQTELTDAARHFEEALRLEPRYAIAHSNLLFALNFDPQIDAQRLFTEHLFWERLHGQGLSTPKPIASDHKTDRPLRIGYVSPDFRTHAVARFMEPILANHDSQRVHAFAYAELTTPDNTSGRFQTLAKGWRIIAGSNDAQVAAQIRADKIDILVDLAGHTAGNRLGVFTYRPAPIQLSYLGYTNTTGLSTIDFRLSDSTVDPPGESDFHTEELVRLPGCFCCYAPPQEAPEIVSPPMLKNGYITFGSTHNLPKLNSEVLQLWCEVLKNIPNARLVLFRKTVQGKTKERLLNFFKENGVDPSRLNLWHDASLWGGYLGVYNQIDVLWGKNVGKRAQTTRYVRLGGG
jgi:hypothetical protein